MPNVRCIRNINLEITRQDGSKETEFFRFGKHYSSELIEVTAEDSEYWNVVLKDGDKINNISRHVFENFGTKIVDAPSKVSVKEKAESVFNPSSTPVPALEDREEREENVKDSKRERQEERSSEV